MSFDTVYGYPCVADPRDFDPDPECSSPEERAAHKLACETYGKPQYQPNKGCYHVIDPSGDLVLHVARTSWGIGANSLMVCDECRDPQGRNEAVHCWDCGRDFCDACWAKHAESDEQ